jgi:GNAT superfamily N-acetyltransferase
MTADDVPLGMRLKDQAGWNQTEADWHRFLALEPDGCFVAELDSVAVGTTTTCVLGRVGWIAMVLVDKPYRHRGVGTRLVAHAVEYLDRRGVESMRLDATSLGRPVYERLGFHAEYELARLTGTAAGAPGDWPVLPISDDRLDGVVELDRLVTGTDRSRLIRRLFEERPEAAGLCLSEQTVSGYAMLRPGTRATHVGPAAAVTPEAGRALADWAMGRCEGGPVLVDIPCENRPAIEWAARRRLATERHFTRMVRGRVVHDRPTDLWASSGPEKG